MAQPNEYGEAPPHSLETPRRGINEPEALPAERANPQVSRHEAEALYMKRLHKRGEITLEQAFRIIGRQKRGVPNWGIDEEGGGSFEDGFRQLGQRIRQNIADLEA